MRIHLNRTHCLWQIIQSLLRFSSLPPGQAALQDIRFLSLCWMKWILPFASKWMYGIAEKDGAIRKLVRAFQ